MFLDEDKEKERRAYFENAFVELEGNIGKEVSCIYWEFGELKGVRGILDDIVPYDYVNIEGDIINFVGERTAIEYVMMQDKDVVYSIFKNPEVENYHGSFRDPMQVINAQKKFLGVSVTEEEMQSRSSFKK